MGSPSGGRGTSRERGQGLYWSKRVEEEEGGEGGRCVEQREQWEDPLATRPEREGELSQTNRGVGGVCVGVVPRVQSKLSRALHAHRGKKLLQDLQNLESMAMKRAIW